MAEDHQSSPTAGGAETEIALDHGVTQGEIFLDMLRHMMAPFLVGMIFGSIWQLNVMPRIDWQVPNPIHGSFAIYLLISPLMYKLLVGKEMSRASEYTMGFAVTACVFSMVWIFQSVYCGAYIPAIAWLWISSYWLQFDFPPFRYGLWHGIGVNVGAFGGSVLSFIYI